MSFIGKAVLLTLIEKIEIMTLTGNEKVGELVAQDYKLAPIFKSKGIDFCCQGQRTVQEACHKKGVALLDLQEALTQANSNEGTAGDKPGTWPLDFLCDYIEKTHHRYVEQKTNEIMPFLSKVVKVHGHYHPELKEIEALFTEGASALAQHMKKEELILFPYIRKMNEHFENGKPIPAASFGSLENPIAMMREEHETEGNRFAQIAELSNNYQPPQEACTTYRVVYAMLAEFEADLHRHIHLENNILFPRALQQVEQAASIS